MSRRLHGTCIIVYGHVGVTLTDAATLASWATPTGRDSKDRAANLDVVPVNALLGRQALLAGWTTPTANEKARSDEFRQGRALNPREAMLSTPGPTPNGSPAGTASGGRLNPAFPRWLMGYSNLWIVYSPSKSKDGWR